MSRRQVNFGFQPTFGSVSSLIVGLGFGTLRMLGKT